MKNISQRLEAMATKWSKQDTFTRARIKLTLAYILYTSLILLVLSLAVYWLFLSNIDTNIFPESILQKLEKYVGQESGANENILHEVKERLRGIIFLVDVVIVTFSSFFAYFFAKKTLRPVQEALSRQEQFSADIAHELRTPLSVLKSGIQYTLSKKRSEQEYVDLLKEQSIEIDYLIEISNDLLESIHIKEGSLQKERINISELCRNQCQIMQNYSLEKNISLEADIKENIFAEVDQKKIKRVLYNLIKNAIDYSSNKGKVTIKISSKENFYMIAVTDNGVGISKENQKKIFQQFYKIDNSRNLNNNSAGLGLYIVKKIVQVHKGTINCESTLGKGSMFTITLPF